MPTFSISSSFASHPQFAAAGKQWDARREAEKDEAKERVKSLRYEKCDVHPVSEPMLTRGYRVIEKLKEEGWAEELEKHPSTYMRLKGVTGIRIARPLSDKGAHLVDRSLR